MRRSIPLVILLMLLCGDGLSSLAADKVPPLELKDGDRVALVGATLIERDRHFGHIETVLRGRFPGRRLSFRNIAWPGDTTTVQLRPLNFGSFEKYVADQAPTVALVCYGSNEAFEGAAGLPSFLEGYNGICGILEKQHARIVLIAPNRHENLGPPLPNPRAHNENLELYVGAIDELARGRNYLFVNLFDALRTKQDNPPAYPLTENGIHLSDYGYWRAAMAIAEGVGLSPQPWQATIAADGTLSESGGVRVEDLAPSPEGIRFSATSAMIFTPAPGEPIPDEPDGRPHQLLKVAGLPAGDYSLKVDGTVVATGSADQWSRGVAISQGPDFEQGKTLRREVIWKNQLFLHRWRAVNGEYIYGRRASTSEGWKRDKDGGNAGNPTFPKEMAEFDRLIGEADKKSDDLATPKKHTYVLIRR